MTKQILLAGAAAMLAALPASAITQAPSDGTAANYAISATDMSGLHFGLLARYGERAVTYQGHDGEMTLSRAGAYLGYDGLRWFTVYGFAGIAETKANDFFLDGDTAVTFGGGAWAYLIDDDQLDIMSTFSRFRVNLGGEYAFTDSNELFLGEAEGFLTLELLNDSFFTNDIFPGSIGLFAGPVFSYLHGDELKQDVDDAWGITVGLSMTFSRRTYATGGMDVFSDNTVVYASAGFRF